MTPAERLERLKMTAAAERRQGLGGERTLRQLCWKGVHILQLLVSNNKQTQGKEVPPTLLPQILVSNTDNKQTQKKTGGTFWEGYAMDNKQPFVNLGIKQKI